jgi:hypothetical protein
MPAAPKASAAEKAMLFSLRRLWLERFMLPDLQLLV